MRRHQRELKVEGQRLSAVKFAGKRLKQPAGAPDGGAPSLSGGVRRQRHTIPLDLVHLCHAIEALAPLGGHI